MAFSFFKNGDKLYDEGNELISRGEFSKARNILQKSIDKDGGVDDVAAVQVAIIDLQGNLDNPQRFRNLENALNGMGDSALQFGLVEIDRQRMLTECSLLGRRAELIGEVNRAIKSNDIANMKGVADRLQSLAQEFQMNLGDKTFYLYEIFNRDTTTTGTNVFFALMAISYETRSRATVWSNPSEAAEFEQIAMGYRQQNGESGENNMARVRSFAMTGKCWLCGRIATGEGIHFYTTPADVSPALNKDTGTRSAPDDLRSIYICRACYSAVSNRADDIAREYHEQAMSEMRAMEMRIQAEISALQTQISFMRG